MLTTLVLISSGALGCAAEPPDDSAAGRGDTGEAIAPQEPFDDTAEQAAVEEAIRTMIGWAQNRDFDRLYATPVDDSTYLAVHPGDNVVRGYDDFLEGVEWFRSPDFRAVHYEIRDLKITFSRSHDVAWYYCMLDDENEFQGQPANWMNTRWTGVLEKLDGQWHMMQMHFSFAQDG
jgi:ketosteroid isomerase-like protein